jgi:hypothetical protein
MTDGDSVADKCVYRRDDITDNTDNCDEDCNWLYGKY